MKTRAFTTLHPLRWLSSVFRGRKRTGQQSPRSTHTAAEASTILIREFVKSDPVRFILLGADGVINRMETGSGDETDGHLFIGKVDTQLFRAVRSLLTKEMLQNTGRYDFPPDKSSPAKLEIISQFNDNECDGIEFSYDAEGMLPPSEILEFVLGARQLTQAWYEKQKQVGPDNTAN